MHRNARKRIPPRDPARRRLYYALRNKAKRCTSPAQHRYLNGRADALMEWVEVDSEETPPPPPGPKGRSAGINASGLPQNDHNDRFALVRNEQRSTGDVPPECSTTA